MDDYIRKNEHLPTDSEYLKKIINSNNVYIYSDLPKLIRNKKFKLPAIILYLSRKQYGHWVSILKYGKTIEFFDPYGYIPDSELQWANKKFRDKNNEDYPYILDWLEDKARKGYIIEYNHHKFQGPDVSTCGYHAANRILFKDLNLQEYYNFMKKLLKRVRYTFPFINNYDKLVVFLVKCLLQYQI